MSNATPQRKTILGFVEEPSLEGEVLRTLPQVEMLRRDELGAISDSLDKTRLFDLMIRLKEKFPKSPKWVYVFGKEPILAYQLQYLVSLLYEEPAEIVFCKVQPGSFYPGYGRVVSVVRLQSRTEVSKRALASLGRGQENRIRNVLVTVYFLKASIERPVYLSIIEDFMSTYLKKKHVRNQARKIWRFCVKCGLADVEPGYILERTPAGNPGQRRRILLLRANNYGLSWAASNSNLATDEVNLKEIDAVFTEMEKMGALGKGVAYVGQADLLTDFCPVVKGNSEVLSLYAGNFIRTRDAMFIGAPSPCAFSFPKVDGSFAESLVAGRDKSDDNAEGSAKMHLKLINAQTVEGDLLICCSSSRDIQATSTSPSENAAGRLTKMTFDYAGSCPYKLGELCTVVSPPEILEPLKDQLRPEIRRVKLDRC